MTLIFSEEEIIEFGNFATNTALLVKRIISEQKVEKIVFIGSCAADHLYVEDNGGSIYCMYKTWLQSFARELI